VPEPGKTIEQLAAERRRADAQAAADAAAEAQRLATLTLEQVETERQREYGQYVAVGPINHNGVRAYNKGDPVPASNVAKHGYLDDGLVIRTGDEPVMVSPLAATQEQIDAHNAAVEQQASDALAQAKATADEALAAADRDLKAANTAAAKAEKPATTTTEKG
jgi:hypothetical protein